MPQEQTHWSPFLLSSRSPEGGALTGVPLAKRGTMWASTLSRGDGTGKGRRGAVQSADQVRAWSREHETPYERGQDREGPGVQKGSRRPRQHSMTARVLEEPGARQASSRGPRSAVPPTQTTGRLGFIS